MIMTKELVESLAIEEIQKTFTGLEKNYPSYFFGIIDIVSKGILNDYASDAFKTVAFLRECIEVETQKVKKALN